MLIGKQKQNKTSCDDLWLENKTKQKQNKTSFGDRWLEKFLLHQKEPTPHIASDCGFANTQKQTKIWNYWLTFNIMTKRDWHNNNQPQD